MVPSHDPGTSIVGVWTEGSWKYGPISAMMGTFTPSSTSGLQTARLINPFGAAPPLLMEVHTRQSDESNSIHLPFQGAYMFHFQELGRVLHL